MVAVRHSHLRRPVSCMPSRSRLRARIVTSATTRVPISASSCRRSRRPFSGFGDTPEGGSHFLHHFSPLLYLCSPFLLLFRSPVALIAIQACAGAAVAPAIFLMVRKRAGTRLALLAAIVTLLYPPLVGVTFTDFHENGFAPAAIVWLAWAIDARKWRLGALFVAIALAIKEDEALDAHRAGCGIRVCGEAARRCGTVPLCRGHGNREVLRCWRCSSSIVRPLVGGHDTWFALGYITNAEAHQDGIAAVAGRLSFLLEALVPLCFVPLFGRWALLLVVPGADRSALVALVDHVHDGPALRRCVDRRDARRVRGHARADRARSRAESSVHATGDRIDRDLCVRTLSLASPTHWKHYLAPVNAHDRTLSMRSSPSLPPECRRRNARRDLQPPGLRSECPQRMGLVARVRPRRQYVPVGLLAQRLTPEARRPGAEARLRLSNAAKTASSSTAVPRRNTAPLSW